jgi:hypothetical protein
MNKKEVELLKEYLDYFEQTELPMRGRLSNQSMGYNILLLLQTYLIKEIPNHFGKSKKVREVQSFVDSCMGNTQMLLSQLEETIKKNNN